jgi:hypothetical protein
MCVEQKKTKFAMKNYLISEFLMYVCICINVYNERNNTFQVVYL